ncbi:surfactant-associated protein 2 isoform X5 [Arvicanthis niloticus]|uniref:surfactant-associated protein 2 isoform X5 n=1 Tax=Arvicanthis niloticus TaxID=61156 RepID=UPI00402B4C40
MSQDERAEGRWLATKSRELFPLRTYRTVLLVQPLDTRWTSADTGTEEQMRAGEPGTRDFPKLHQVRSRDQTLSSVCLAMKSTVPGRPVEEDCQHPSGVAQGASQSRKTADPKKPSAERGPTEGPKVTLQVKLTEAFQAKASQDSSALDMLQKICLLLRLPSGTNVTLHHKGPPLHHLTCGA